MVIDNVFAFVIRLQFKTRSSVRGITAMYLHGKLAHFGYDAMSLMAP